MKKKLVDTIFLVAFILAIIYLIQAIAISFNYELTTLLAAFIAFSGVVFAQYMQSKNVNKQIDDQNKALEKKYINDLALKKIESINLGKKDSFLACTNLQKTIGDYISAAYDLANIKYELLYLEFLAQVSPNNSTIKDQLSRHRGIHHNYELTYFQLHEKIQDYQHIINYHLYMDGIGQQNLYSESTKILNKIFDLTHKMDESFTKYESALTKNIEQIIKKNKDASKLIIEIKNNATSKIRDDCKKELLTLKEQCENLFDLQQKTQIGYCFVWRKFILSLKDSSDKESLRSNL